MMSHTSRRGNNIDLLPHTYHTLDDGFKLHQSVTYLPTQTSPITLYICKKPRDRYDYESVNVRPHDTLKYLKELVVRYRNLNTSFDTFHLVMFDENEYEWREIDDSNLSATIKQLKLPPRSILSMEYNQQQSQRSQSSVHSTPVTTSNDELTLKLCTKPMDRTDCIHLKTNSFSTLGQLRKQAYEKFNRSSKDQSLYLWNKDSWIKFEPELDDMNLADSGFQSLVFITLDFNEETFDSTIPRGLCGLTNLGNTCFMNSAFQCLSNIPEFTKRILTLSDDIDADVVGAYKKLMRDMWSGRYRVIELSSLLINIGDNLPRYAGYRQQDAQEFMNHFLHLIHAELTNEETLITELFFGEIQSTGTCLGCHQIERTNESISFLPLPICDNNQKTLLYIKANGEQSLVYIKIDSFITTIGQLIDCFIKQYDSTLTGDQIQAVHLVNNLVIKEHKSRKSLTNIRDEELAFVERPKKSVLEKYIWCEFLDHSTGKSFRPPIYLICPEYECRYTHLVDQINQLLAHLCSTTNAPVSACYLYWINQDQVQHQLSVEASSDEDLLFLSIITIEMGSQWIDTYENSYNINRSIDNSSLTSLLNDFFREELLDGDYYCSKCLKSTKARQKSNLCLPLSDVLIIHLKRFKYDIHSTDKIDTFVKFPLCDLDLKEYIVKNHNDINQTALSTKYDLVAVSNHTGSLISGHYTTYAKNIHNEKWYSFDDKYVQKFHNDEDIVTKNAYILVYVKCKTHE